MKTIDAQSSLDATGPKGSRAGLKGMGDRFQYELRYQWREGSGDIIFGWQLCRPGSWWRHVTRPAGLLLIVLAVLWPIFLIALGWFRLGAGFAVADVVLVSTGLELAAAGQRRWLS